MSNNKKLIYVGGLAEEVDEPVLRAAFNPFGKFRHRDSNKFPMEVRVVLLVLGNPDGMKNSGSVMTDDRTT